MHFKASDTLGDFIRRSPRSAKIARCSQCSDCDKTKPIYSLGGQFRSVENTKDLGVTISSDLSWGKHVFAMVNKANMVWGIIKRSIGTNNQDVFSQLYKSLVRPILGMRFLFGART